MSISHPQRHGLEKVLHICSLYCWRFLSTFRKSLQKFRVTERKNSFCLSQHSIDTKQVLMFTGRLSADEFKNFSEVNR
jgi:hypothetical protein